ncbi:phosphatidylinositol-specific phospholipase C1-like protein [Streptomyces sp. P38-E01]|uniref:Phosphatidylinositol-specific phospholipase C1-like protein n=1 Tax=Streptomyces tardus TaxID=2780544 RepID=A0A949N6C5_9ACTN|nr:phosphatidylinositol-specific phospholipase C1-like protein [Streptomyces tardus]
MRRRSLARGLLRLVSALTGLATAAALTTAAQAGPSRDPAGGLRLNQIQAVATHNSYHREVGFAEQRVMGEYDANFGNLLYSHASLPVQFAEQKVRGIELDVFPDPRGGLYAEPLIRGFAGQPPLGEPELERPGFKVLHWADFDYASSCASLRGCLRQVKRWSDANPGHVTVPILLELKRTDPQFEKLGGAVSPAWTTGLLDALDAEIRTVFGEDRTVTPDDLRRKGRTLEESVLRHGWPKVADTRGQVMFLMDNDDRAIQDAYRAGGRESLQGRVLFTDAEPGRPDAAFVKENDPTGAGGAKIAELVERGYYVRTRSDVPLDQASTGDRTMLRAALASGAQMVSTDFPSPGMAARYGSDYTARLPEGATVRCNPVSVPAERCPGRDLERDRLARS